MSWYRQSYRHSLAAKGIRTSLKTKSLTSSSFVQYHPQVAMERFDLSRLKFLGQGRDRTVFGFEDDPTKVLKLAHNPTGLRQNLMEAEAEIGAKPLYIGKDFIVMQRATPLGDDEDLKKWRAKTARLHKLENLLYKLEGGQGELETKEQRLLKVLGLENIVNYPNIASGDIAKASSWGILPNKRMVLIDKGGLDVEAFEPDVQTMINWEDVLKKREQSRVSGKESLVYLTIGDEYVPGIVWNVEDFKKTGHLKDRWTIRPKIPTTTRTGDEYEGMA